MTRRTPAFFASCSTFSVPPMLTSLLEIGSASDRGTEGIAASWYTNSTPAQARAVAAGSRMSPSISSMSFARSARFSRLPEKKLSRTRTLSPRVSSARAMEEPMNPAPPVTR